MTYKKAKTRDKKTKGQRDRESKGQRDKETKPSKYSKQTSKHFGRNQISFKSANKRHGDETEGARETTALSSHPTKQTRALDRKCG